MLSLNVSQNHVGYYFFFLENLLSGHFYALNLLLKNTNPTPSQWNRTMKQSPLTIQCALQNNPQLMVT